MRNILTAAAAATTITCALAAPAAANPTGLFIVPTTDTQKPASVRGELGPSYQHKSLVNGGVQFGVTRRVEAGIDSIGPRNTSNLFNAKVRVHDEGTVTPAIAVGIANAGRESAAAPAPNMLYGVASKHVGPVRLTAGGYRFSNSFANYSGSMQKSGVMLAANVPGHKFSPSLEHVTGRNPYGMTAAGVAYHATPNLTVYPAYVFFNDHQYGSNGLRVQVRASFGR